MRKFRKGQSETIFPLKIEKLEKIISSKFKGNPDLSFSIYERENTKIAIFFISYLVEEGMVQESLINPILSKNEKWTSISLLNEVPLASGLTVEKLGDIQEKLLIGTVFVYVEGEEKAVSYLLPKKEKRSISMPETESVVLGPKAAFTESLITNMNLVHWSIRSTDLVLEKIMIGKRAPLEVRLIYLKSLANETDVNTMRQRLQDLVVDDIGDSNELTQYIEDSSSTIFPQYHTTELPDLFTYNITKGKIGLLVENSPSAILAPSTLFSFLESTEDLYMRWNIGSFFRILRFFAMFISILLTPAYVAAVTYHYETIPTQLLISIGQSRAKVPFSPIFEAILLELLIELLREAGARLPTKVGQTIGIVGGVVVGTAAVQAGITSDILIIFITMSALASFTAPSYMLGTAVRVVRFPMIILAGTLGIIGIMFGICFLVIHLLKLTSLGRPYLSPIYPFQWQDLNKVLFRLPPYNQSKRFVSYRPKDLFRFSKRKSKKKKDIDE